CFNMRFYGHIRTSPWPVEERTSEGGSPTSRAEHPDGSLPRHHTVKDVLGYRDGAGREFVRGVAHGTHRQRCRHRHADVSRPDTTSSQPTIFAPLAEEACRGAPHGRILIPNRNRPDREATHDWRDRQERPTFQNSVQHNEFSGSEMIAGSAGGRLRW